ncbi:hypothetical protein [Ihuprevotella massiliensis]|uniref:hypothetical protein n=1 Tax=Ihuprevotella massiliensis TaxID=1852368 RepID=UPI00094E0597
MLTIWAIAFVLGLIALCVSLWVTFWVVMFVVVLFRVAHQDLSYRRAEKHHPGIYARFQRTLALREAQRKRKEAHDKWSKAMQASINKRKRQASAHRTAAAWAAFASL